MPYAWKGSHGDRLTENAKELLRNSAATTKNVKMLRDGMLVGESCFRCSLPLVLKDKQTLMKIAVVVIDEAEAVAVAVVVVVVAVVVSSARRRCGALTHIHCSHIPRNQKMEQNEFPFTFMRLSC